MKTLNSIQDAYILMNINNMITENTDELEKKFSGMSKSQINDHISNLYYSEMKKVGNNYKKLPKEVQDTLSFAHRKQKSMDYTPEEKEESKKRQDAVIAKQGEKYSGRY